MEIKEIKQNLCNIKLKKAGIVISVYDPRTYKAERIDIIKNFVRFKIYDDFVEIYTKNNSYMYASEEIVALISYSEYKELTKDGVTHSIPIYNICQLEISRINQQNAYNDYQFQNFLNQTK